MNSIKMGNIEVSISSIIMLVGAVLAIIALFLDWTIFEEVGISGTELLSQEKDGLTIEDLSFIRLAPLFILIFALVAAVMAVAEGFLAGKIDAKVFAIATAVVAALALIFAIIYLAMGGGIGLFTGESKEMLEVAIDLGYGPEIKLAAGAWIGFIGSLLAVGGAGWNIKEKF